MIEGRDRSSCIVLSCSRTVKLPKRYVESLWHRICPSVIPESSLSTPVVVVCPIISKQHHVLARGDVSQQDSNKEKKHAKTPPVLYMRCVVFGDGIGRLVCHRCGRA